MIGMNGIAWVCVALTGITLRGVCPVSLRRSRYASFAQELTRTARCLKNGKMASQTLEKRVRACVRFFDSLSSPLPRPLIFLLFDVISSTPCHATPAQLFESIFVPTPKEEDGPSAPGLEGLPHAHSDRGTHRNVGLIACSAEGMQTLVEGQAPTDMDRFKAWHMDPRYHAVSHVRPCQTTLPPCLFFPCRLDSRRDFRRWIVKVAADDVCTRSKLLEKCKFLLGIGECGHVLDEHVVERRVTARF